MYYKKYLGLLLFLQPIAASREESHLCQLCQGTPNCYQSGIYSTLALPTLNGSRIRDMSVIFSVAESSKPCDVMVRGPSSSPDWRMEPFYMFEDLPAPNKVVLRSEWIPLEGTYEVHFGLNKSLSFDVFYPYFPEDPMGSLVVLNASDERVKLPEGLRRCLVRSKKKPSDPDILSKLCTDFETRPCFTHEVNVSLMDSSFEWIHVSFNESLYSLSPLNLTLRCLLDARVPMKGRNFYSGMRILYDPPNKLSRQAANLRLSGYGMDISMLVISLLLLIFWVNAMILLLKRRRGRHLAKNLGLHFIRSDKGSEAKGRHKDNKAFPPWAKERYFDVARIEFGKELGRGMFGIVRRGKLSDGPHRKWDVAMKESFEDRDESLLAEGKIMSAVGYHNHIVNLQCVSWNMRGHFILILEYCHNGRIIDFLQNHREKYFKSCWKGNHREDLLLYSLESLLVWGSQISSGMEFLDSKNVIHGDLAGRNVLLSLEYAAKIADFGLAHSLYQETVREKKLTQRRLPLIWMGPETLETGVISKKSDVWAFGVLMWEILTLGKTPYEGFSEEALKATVLSGVCRLERPPKLCPDPIWDLIQTCWDPDPGRRPDFSSIKLRLETTMDKEPHLLDHMRREVESMQRRFFNNPGYSVSMANDEGTIED